MRGWPRARTSSASARAARTQQEMPPRWSRAAASTSIRRAAALVEAGDIVMNIAAGLFDASHIRGELGELVLGRVEGRTSADGHHDLQVARHGGGRRGRRRPGVSPRLGNRSRNGADVMNDELPQEEAQLDSDRHRRAVAVRHHRRRRDRRSRSSGSGRTSSVTQTQRRRRDAAVRRGAQRSFPASSR